MAMEASKTSITSTWMHRNSELYLSAIRAPFILSIREGTLDHRFYTRWLGQDYLFVKEFCRFAASVVVKAPESIGDEDLDILMGGLSALQAELLWFRSQSVQWNTKFEGLLKHSVTEGYCRLLKSLAGPDIEYPVIISAFWAIEMVYNESFATCLETDANTPPELLEACQRWGSKDFKTYCICLKRMADRALQNAAQDMLQKAEEYFQEILKQEVSFWSMSFDDDEGQVA
ncbi:formylaminopyrimidine deformylase / aminopyrimidine aminohydrolase [Marchantia polymorpha subsp. ruderalis]|uniref:Thiaminase-2/PQQC domain-containing protein n=2 Tax=Marchantia polymorpha TaxID=3197 RepID=A0A176WMY6_MARPO|nr:hypothetical protein AXG93_4875s1490 [Marchantia polymorpha subsp. ruderalis]PTQ49404.1 hypothetical protein MARPO_0003s0261 [Marchantia polymorpha]BBN17168.1 hypothetical protein Mp_7g12530 [Marchantia polymorpha subsp. ruderalis]|eukprot:PTQ49404.1 hypothetical protein MARPO_0003s0261 [Marchantia polymorpha]